MLQWLELSHNGLTGALPASSLAGLGGSAAPMQRLALSHKRDGRANKHARPARPLAVAPRLTGSSGSIHGGQ